MLAKLNNIEYIEQKRMHLDKEGNVLSNAFTFSVIAMAGKLASSDGPINKYEKTYFSEIFETSIDKESEVQSLLLEAAKEHQDVDHYAKWLSRMFGDKPKLLKNVVKGLFRFADIDGFINGNEAKILKKIVLSFGLESNLFEQQLKDYVMPDHKSPYEALGVNKKVKLDELKQAYYSKVKDCHPDAHVKATDLPEYNQIMQEKFNYYTEAYQIIRAKRKLN